VDNDTLAGQTEKPEKPAMSTAAGYKAICAKIGVVMCVYFVLRALVVFIAVPFRGLLDTFSYEAVNALYTGVMMLLLYLVPLITAIIIFKISARSDFQLGSLYKKPKRLAKVIGNFPAMYGFGYGMALLTILFTYILSKISDLKPVIEEIFKPIALEPSSDILGVIIMVFAMVVIAPIFEEFLCRGIFFGVLRPYGNGIAIIISSLLFGLMHGSMYMLFYTTALGLCLGYVRYATNSLFAVTILHAILNSVSAGLLLISSLMEITLNENKLINTFFNMYLTAMLILVFIGITVFVLKIPQIRKYKIENAWTEISGGKKIAIFLTSIPIILMVIMAVNEHIGNPLLHRFINSIN